MRAWLACEEVARDEAHGRLAVLVGSWLPLMRVGRTHDESPVWQGRAGVRGGSSL